MVTNGLIVRLLFNMPDTDNMAANAGLIRKIANMVPIKDPNIHTGQKPRIICNTNCLVVYPKAFDKPIRVLSFSNLIFIKRYKVKPMINIVIIIHRIQRIITALLKDASIV